MRSTTPLLGKSSGGPRLDRSTTVSKIGTHYWEFSWQAASGHWPESSMPVWGSELAAFISTLESLAEISFKHNSWPNEGQYPVKSLLTASGGLLWIVTVRHQETCLALRRMS